MWLTCFLLSVCSLLFFVILAVVSANGRIGKHLNAFYTMFGGVFVSAVFLFFPVNAAVTDMSGISNLQSVLLSIFRAMQIFTIGTEFEVVTNSISYCPDGLDVCFKILAAFIFVIAPVFTFGFVLSLFKNISAYSRYLGAFFKDVYVFSELNEISLALAEDIKKNNPKVAVVYTDVYEKNDEVFGELSEKAKTLNAICFKKDLLAINFKRHSKNKQILFFTIGNDETENLNQSLKIIGLYNMRENTRLFVFASKVESELLLTSVNKGFIKVRRVNAIRALINRNLYESGTLLFDNAGIGTDGSKKISAVVVGMGGYGREMVKALSWYCQMDGYSVEINAFDKDELASKKFNALAPELMSPIYNGVSVEGEAQYLINIHSKIDAETSCFADAISKIKNATYVFVALGRDDININTAVTLRMLFERIGIHPVIQAVVYSSEQKRALAGIKNYRGQEYDIQFIGDLESSYAENVIIDSELEEDALSRHLKWGEEDEFWTYEYNYNSSVASAIHMKARIHCDIPGADKKEADLTEAERNIIEVLEHKRWNAYMRSEGYIFSGSKDKSSRNDLAKMHHDLVDFESLSDEDKRKDSKVGTS